MTHNSLILAWRSNNARTIVLVKRAGLLAVVLPGALGLPVPETSPRVGVSDESSTEDSSESDADGIGVSDPSSVNRSSGMLRPPNSTSHPPMIDVSSIPVVIVYSTPGGSNETSEIEGAVICVLLGGVCYITG
jgi:hypothetical protein